jgi:prolyl 4-hydroxylase
MFIPNAKKIANSCAEIYVLDDFLSTPECDHIIQLIRSYQRPSELINPDEADAEFRNHWSSDLEHLQDCEVEDINERIAQLMGFAETSSEFLQGQRYSPGQQFKPHTDYFEVSDLDKYSEDLGQRTYTVLIYLNDEYSGGETDFPLLNFRFSPKRGTALVWNNLDSNGIPNTWTKHQGLPVVSGEKFVTTKWFRSTTTPALSTRTPAEHIKPYTKLGLKKMSIPVHLFHTLAAFYHSRIQKAMPERGCEHLIMTGGKSCGSELIELTDNLRKLTQTILQPIAEEWLGKSLKPTYVYGVRIYRNSCVLGLHRDRPNTHVIGIVLNIDQDVLEDWPLVIQDHTYRTYHVSLRPGEMLLFEGARLQHGRPIPLRGTRFANVFCHYIPTDWVDVDFDD